MRGITSRGWDKTVKGRKTEGRGGRGLREPDTPGRIDDLFRRAVAREVLPRGVPEDERMVYSREPRVNGGAVNPLR